VHCYNIAPPYGDGGFELAGKYHHIGEAPRTIKTADGRAQFVVSGDYMAFGIEGAPVFATEGDTPGHVTITKQLPDSGGAPLAEGEWSPSVRLLPAWVEFDLYGRDEPDFRCRIELRDEVPRLVELGWRANENQNEIRQKHLRAAEIADLVNTVYRSQVFEVRDVWRDKPGMAIPTISDEQNRIIRNLVHDMRAGRRHVNTEMLRQVAEVYRANFDEAPAEAVARTFGVKQRMAHEYVRRARERGFLPPTTQGKKRV
jgi:hypothetical protein